MSNLRKSATVQSVMEDVVASVAVQDPATGEFLPELFSLFLSSLGEYIQARDTAVPWTLSLRGWDFCKHELRSILQDPRTRHERKYVCVKPHKARAIDLKALSWLSRQPGRTAREKAAVRGEVQTVVRPQTAKLLENQLVCRVLRGLFLRAKSERAAAEQLEPHHARDVDRIKILGEVIRCYAHDLSRSELAGLPLGGSPRPNNVLLHDSRYSKVWRVWGWLLRKPRAITQAETQCWLAQLVGFAVLAVFEDQDSVSVSEALVLPRDPLEGSLLVDPVAGCDLNFQALFRTAGQELRSVSISVDASGCVTWARHNWVTDAEGCRPVLLDNGQIVAQAKSDNWVRIDVGGTAREIRYEGPAALSALHKFARGIAQELVGEQTDRSVLIRPASAIGRIGTWTQAAWDIRTPLSRFVTPATHSETSEKSRALVLSRHLAGNDGRAAWVPGDSVLRIPERAGGRVFSLSDRWPAIEQGTLEKEEADAVAKALEGALMACGKPSQLASLALVVPDSLVDSGVSKLRSLVPTGPRETWFVWSSVAAALAWRASGACDKAGMKSGDGLLVLVADGPRLQATLLRAARVEDESADPWVWNRVPRGALDLANSLSWSSLATGCAPDELAEEAAARYVNHGWFESAECRADSVVWFQDGERQQRRLVRPHHRPSKDIVDEVHLWLEELGQSAGFRKCRNLVEGKLHVLATGFPSDQRAWSPILREFATELDAPLHQFEPKFAEGAGVFLDRRRRGLPTWRDEIPHLFLELEDGQEMKIFDSKEVDPGDKVESRPMRFEIPAGIRSVKLQLRRQFRDGSSPESAELFLEDSSLPADIKIRVSVQVRFHYAEDAFRIVVAPDSSSDMPTLELAWSEGVEDHATATVINDPPGYPERTPWSSDESLFRGFPAATEALYACLTKMESKKTKHAIAGLKSKKTSTANAAAGELIAELGDKVVEVGDLISKLWTPDRSPDDCPDVIQEALVKTAVPAMMSILRLEQGGRRVGKSAKKRKSARKRGTTTGPQLSRIWTELDGNLGSRFKQVQRHAAVALARLRWDAPESYVRALLEDEVPALQREQFTGWSQALGRVIAREPSDLTIEVAGALLVNLEQAVQSDRLSTVRDVLWAYSTAIWSHESAVHTFGQYVERLLQVVRTLFSEKVSNAWKDHGSRSEVYREMLSLTLGLLLLRDDPKANSFVQASSDLAKELKQSILDIESKWPKQKEYKEPRIAFARSGKRGAATTASFADELADCLLGTRVGQLSPLQDD